MSDLPSTTPAALRAANRIWALTVVLIYAVFGALWILLSDKAVAWLFGGPSQAALASTIKGWAFIAVTSLILYGLLHRRRAASEGGTEDIALSNRWPLVFALVAMVITGVVGLDLFYSLTNPTASGLPSTAGERQASWSLALALLALFVSGAGVFMWRQFQALALARSIQDAECERLRAHKLLAAIANGSEDAIFAKDLNQRYILFNQAASRLVGKPVEEVLGRDDHSLFPAEQSERLIAAGREVFATQRTVTQEEVLDTSQGTMVFLATKGPLRDENGEIVGLLGISRDITPAKAIENALRTSERRFLDIVAASRDWIWELDARGRFTYVSDSIEDLLGYPPAEILGKTPFDLMPPPEAVRVRARFSPFDLRRSAFRDLRHTCLHRDGSPRQISTNGLPILDESGRLLGYRGIDRDITEQAQAETQLRASEALFRALFESAPVSILIHDQESGAIIDANRRGIASYGYSTLAELQNSHFTCEPPYSLAEAVSLIRKAASEGTQRFEWMSRDRFGKVFWEEVVLSPIRLEGVDRVMAIGLDISVRKAVEERMRRKAAEMAERFDELRRFNRATVGRELAMIELKKQVNALSQELGREAPYPLAFLPDSDRSPP